eukprot:TRINITY_DN8214_c0_g1_i2.p1 TRINITY_DN8214_c0_g1~~TRINITY_DN8214_c0_g1_i2.p1  ORF type:complete len:195 (-),score=21.63 TRINITY_DN8214_c0_g1_i2:178-762(-)
MNELEAEASVLAKIKHPNVVLFLGIHEETKSKDKYIVTEFIERGSLLDVIRSEDDNMDQLLFYALGAAKGMAYLESCSIIHRDLAARNLLVDATGNVKVADFGLSRAITSNYYESTSNNFPIRWSAPEVLQYSKFSSKSDVWSMGITLFEIVTRGQIPYKGLSNEEVVSKVVDEGYRMSKPSECMEDVWSLICE